MAKLTNISMLSSSLRLLRAVPTLAAVCLAGGCSVLGGGDLGSIIAITKAALSGGSKVTLEEASAVPYSSLGMRLDGSSQTMLILVGDSNGQQLWTSGAGVAITTSTQDGRILRTAGFQHNLGGYAPGTNIVSQDGVRTVRWQGDFPNLKLYSVDMTCRDRPAGDETIIILGKDIHTKRIDESCVSNGNRLDWSFENIYWIDPDNGLVWRSIQHVNPMLDAIELEILRPPPEH